MLKPIRFISIDDSLLDQLMLKELAVSFPFLEHIGSFSTPLE